MRKNGKPSGQLFPKVLFLSGINIMPLKSHKIEFWNLKAPQLTCKVLPKGCKVIVLLHKMKLVKILDPF